MLRKAGDERVAEALEASSEGLELHPAERELVKKLLAFPAEVAEAADRRAPHRIAVYALELAQTFTAFYRDCQVVGAEPRAVESFRIAPLGGLEAHDRPRARPARRLGAGDDVEPLQLVEEVQAEAVERVLGLEVERRELAGEQQDAHRDQHRAGDRGDDQVAVAQPAERASWRA